MRAEPSSGQVGSAAVSASKVIAEEATEVTGGLELILAFVRRYGRWLLGITLLFGALAWGYQRFLERPLFEATAIVAIGPIPRMGAFEPPKVPPAGYLHLANSSNILERTHRELRQAGLLPVGTDLVRSHMRAELAKATKGGEANTSLLLLTYWGESDEMAVEAANGWARVLIGFDLRQAQKAYLNWALTEAKEEQAALAERMSRLATRLAATRAVLETTPTGLYITARRSEDGASKQDARQLSLSHEDRTAVSAELAMRVAETEIEMNLTRPKKREADSRLQALSLLNDRFRTKGMDFDDVVAEDTAGLLAEVRTRVSLLQPATTSTQSVADRVLFKILLAMIAGFLLALMAAGLLEAMRGRQSA